MELLVCFIPVLNIRLAINEPNNNTLRFFFWMLVIAIVLSASAAVLYHEFTNDISTAVSLATYIVTCFALMLALVAAGDYVGLKKPQSEPNFDYNSNSGICFSNWQESVRPRYSR